MALNKQQREREREMCYKELAYDTIFTLSKLATRFGMAVPLIPTVLTDPLDEPAVELGASGGVSLQLLLLLLLMSTTGSSLAPYLYKSIFLTFLSIDSL